MSSSHIIVPALPYVYRNLSFLTWVTCGGPRWIQASILKEKNHEARAIWNAYYAWFPYAVSMLGFCWERGNSLDTPPVQGTSITSLPPSER